MITRFILLILFCGASLSGFSQKKKKKDQNAFPYSYKCEARDYIRYDYYHLNIAELNADTILISGDIDTTITGKIVYSHESFSGEIVLDDGKFQLKVPKTASYGLLLITFDFEQYLENENHINLNELPDDFYLVMERESIFDPETPYVTINSKKLLSSSELKELIDCLGNSKKENHPCYEEGSIQMYIQI